MRFRTPLRCCARSIRVVDRRVGVGHERVPVRRGPRTTDRHFVLLVAPQAVGHLARVRVDNVRAVVLAALALWAEPLRKQLGVDLLRRVPIRPVRTCRR